MTHVAGDHRGQRQGAARSAPVAPETHTRIVLRPLASSAPVAFFAFGMGTITYTALQLQWISLTESNALVVILLAFVAPLEIIAALIAYASRDGGLATTMLIFGAVWTSIAIAMHISPPGSRSTLLGIFLLTAATMLLGMSSASILSRPLLFGLSLLAVARFTVSGVYELTGNVTVQHSSGWLGIPILAVALYGGVAFLLEDTMGRTIAPLGRRSDASTALHGDLSQQIEHVTQEAGVRRTL